MNSSDSTVRKKESFFRASLGSCVRVVLFSLFLCQYRHRFRSNCVTFPLEVLESLDNVSGVCQECNSVVSDRAPVAAL